MSAVPFDRPPTVPLRSVLFVPGSEADELDAALGSGADALIIDLEEPRTPFTDTDRVAARALVRRFLDHLAPPPRQGLAINSARSIARLYLAGGIDRDLDRRGGGDGDARPGADDHTSARPLMFARVNGPWTGRMLGDLRAVLGPSLTGILLPKITGPDHVIAADALLLNLEIELEVPAGSTVIYPILETAQAIRNAYEIAMASPRVAYMGGAISRFGDIHQAIGYRWTAEGNETHHIRSRVLVDAKAAGIRYPISGMWGGPVDDLDGLRAFAEELRDLGYYGMMLGHAAHVGVVHEVFTPSDAEIALWQELVDLAEHAAVVGGGPIRRDDPASGELQVVHQAHVGSARLNLEWARALPAGATEPP